VREGVGVSVAVAVAVRLKKAEELLLMDAELE
jgi:hypothetical protein